MILDSFSNLALLEDLDNSKSTLISLVLGCRSVELQNQNSDTDRNSFDLIAEKVWRKAFWNCITKDSWIWIFHLPGSFWVHKKNWHPVVQCESLMNLHFHEWSSWLLTPTAVCSLVFVFRHRLPPGFWPIWDCILGVSIGWGMGQLCYLLWQIEIIHVSSMSTIF